MSITSTAPSLATISTVCVSVRYLHLTPNVYIQHIPALSNGFWILFLTAARPDSMNFAPVAITGKLDLAHELKALGVASADCPKPLCHHLWTQLAGPWKFPHTQQNVSRVAPAGVLISS
jgi:hypothetical protein